MLEDADNGMGCYAIAVSDRLTELQQQRDAENKIKERKEQQHHTMTAEAIAFDKDRAEARDAIALLQGEGDTYKPRQRVAKKIRSLIDVIYIAPDGTAPEGEKMLNGERAGPDQVDDADEEDDEDDEESTYDEKGTLLSTKKRRRPTARDYAESHARYIVVRLKSGPRSFYFKTIVPDGNTRDDVPMLLPFEELHEAQTQ
jgi:hypothetical protein